MILSKLNIRSFWNKIPYKNKKVPHNKNWRIEKIRTGKRFTEYDTIWRCIAQNNALIITQISPIFKSRENKLSLDVPNKIEPKKQITTQGQIDQWGIFKRKIPIRGTIKTYKPVKKPALVADVLTIPICWNNAANPNINPLDDEHIIKWNLLLTFISLILRNNNKTNLYIYCL